MQYGSVGSRFCGSYDRNATDAGSRLVLPSTCEFSTDPVGSGFSLFIYRGAAVPFVAGLVTRVLIPPQLPHMVHETGSGEHVAWAWRGHGAGPRPAVSHNTILPTSQPACWPACLAARCAALPTMASAALLPSRPVHRVPQHRVQRGAA